MRLNFRRIGCFCLLLVVIGFFCPIACDSNGFEIAKGGSADSRLIFALYGLFIAAIGGVIVGVALMVKKDKDVPIIIDWLVTLTCMGCGLIPFFLNVNKWGRYYQSGAYMILFGIILSFVSLLIASVMNEQEAPGNMFVSIDKLLNKEGNTVAENSEPNNDAGGGQTPQMDKTSVLTERAPQSQSPAVPPVAGVFPRILPCPSCGKKLKAAGQGRFRCPGCQGTLVIDGNGNCAVG